MKVVNLVVSRLTAEKERILKLRDDFKKQGDEFDYDTIAALEQAAKTIDLLIKKTPWDKLSEEQLTRWLSDLESFK